MLRWMCGNTRRDKIRNEDIRTKIGVAFIEEKIRENCLRWFGHVRRTRTDVPVQRVECFKLEQVKRVRGRPKKTWMEVIRQDIEAKGLSEGILFDRIEWRKLIHVCNGPSIHRNESSLHLDLFYHGFKYRPILINICNIILGFEVPDTILT